MQGVLKGEKEERKCLRFEALQVLPVCCDKRSREILAALFPCFPSGSVPAGPHSRVPPEEWGLCPPRVSPHRLLSQPSPVFSAKSRSEQCVITPDFMACGVGFV